MADADCQVPDDTLLLEKMLRDEAAAPELYRPTNYWTVYGQQFVPELSARGLKDFRRRRDSILASFGATDLWRMPSLKRWPFEHLPASARRRLAAAMCRTQYYRARRTNWLMWCFSVAQQYGEQRGARPLSSFTGSLAGRPEEYFERNGKIYTALHLYYYMQYAYCALYTDFNSVSCIVELGSGSGKQVEVIKRLHPHVTFLLFDIAPQLYVCEQYLKTVFPESVVSYRDTSRITAFDEEASGKIFIFGTHQFPLIKSVAVDLFWNSASFQEMEPPVVQNYLADVRAVAKNIYLREQMAGKEQALSEGVHGVREPVKLHHYVNSLPGFQMLDFSSCFEFGWFDASPAHYYDCFWKREE